MTICVYTAFAASVSLSAQPPATPAGQDPGRAAQCEGNRKPWVSRWVAMTPQSAFGREPESAQRGRAAFQALGCSNCHGAAAEGDSGPDLLRSSLVRRDPCGSDIKRSITEGHGGAPRPAVPPNEAQIYQIVDYIHRRIDETDFNPLYSRAEVERMLLTGNPVAGRAYFEGAGGCSGCHSPTGDLKAIASKYDAVTLELRLISPAADRRRATVTLSSGQTFQGQLLSIDAFDVSISGEDGWRQTWPRTVVKVDVQDPLAAHWDLIDKYSNVVIHDLLAYLETLK